MVRQAGNKEGFHQQGHAVEGADDSATKTQVSFDVCQEAVDEGDKALSTVATQNSTLSYLAKDQGVKGLLAQRSNPLREAKSRIASRISALDSRKSSEVIKGQDTEMTGVAESASQRAEGSGSARQDTTAKTSRTRFLEERGDQYLELLRSQLTQIKSR